MSQRAQVTLLAWGCQFLLSNSLLHISTVSTHRKPAVFEAHTRTSRGFLIICHCLSLLEHISTLLAVFRSIWGSVGRGDPGRMLKGMAAVPRRCRCSCSLEELAEAVTDSGAPSCSKSKTNSPTQVRVKTLKGEKAPKGPRTCASG